MIDKEVFREDFDQLGVFVNFFRQSGTGKTLAAEIIANKLEKKLMIVNYANLESALVGKTSKNIHAIFKIAEKEDSVLMFDEADSFLSARITELRQSADYGVNTSRSQLLKELEVYSRVVIFATNNIKNYDPAFQRRIQYNINFPLPDFDARVKILKHHCFSRQISPDVNFHEISKNTGDFSGGNIGNLVRLFIHKGMKDVLSERTISINQEHFNYGIEQVKSSKLAFGMKKRVSAVAPLKEALTDRTFTKKEKEYS